MFTWLTEVADRALAVVVPHAEAAASCTPRQYYVYRCYEHTKQRKLCTDEENCSTICGPWQTLPIHC